ncbi:MAG: hypothetical protein CM15mP74_07320 [Halieaceae bacterium]|nr:MAG: hypothetical protein CM15mP74_07320 [Halieaceae bacterium]
MSELMSERVSEKTSEKTLEGVAEGVLTESRSEISAHIAHVTLTRADKMNALDPAMFEAIWSHRLASRNRIACESWWYRVKAELFVRG